ncbi:hypothetical protein CXB51_004742 [Gossypium anomalum]|uniref:DUF7745 domain-containing protein n=1 Tax=Gossypium anomalum TaxID=47600 RepID=A0A8J6D7Z6_9ROSI|nr:hypothetical protein CXB51_004742 [Gossypium anomalum]
MRNEYLNKVEDNASVCTWSEKIQLEKGDSVTEGYTSELWDFTRNYGDLPYLLDVKVDRHLFRAMVQFWNPAYSCFTFGDVDLVPTLEEYTTLLRCSRIQGHKAYVRPASLPAFTKKLVMITGMSEQWVVARVQAKGVIMRRFADLFDQLGKQNTSVPAILAETIRSLSASQRAGEGRREVDRYSAEPSRGRDVMWKAPWLVPSEVLYQCGNFDWIPLPRIWGVVGYTPLLVLRQYQSRQQFIPATQGLAQSDFSIKKITTRRGCERFLRLGRSILYEDLD